MEKIEPPAWPEPAVVLHEMTLLIKCSQELFYLSHQACLEGWALGSCEAGDPAPNPPLASFLGELNIMHTNVRSLQLPFFLYALLALPSFPPSWLP